MQQFIQFLHKPLFVLGMLGLSAGIGFLVHFIFFRLLRLWQKEAKSIFPESIKKNLRTPLRILFPLLAFQMLIPYTRLPTRAVDAVGQILGVLVIVTVSWLLIRFLSVLEDFIMSRFAMEAEDNLRARQVYTQVQFFKKVVIIVIAVIALSTILMNFSRVRQLGTTLLASAGVIGIIIGFAAQKTLGNLFAGLQIAVAQPIKIDDVVIVENEWGRIEEITLTYVVVRIWDLRRLIIPITYFTDKPFQNWTKVSADLLGTVYLYVDYTVSVGAVREELCRILEGEELWDGKVCTLQVTNTNERTMELRALMSARDSSDAWNLRCLVRERLVDFVQRNYPHSLPRLRTELQYSREEQERREDTERV